LQSKCISELERVSANCLSFDDLHSERLIPVSSDELLRAIERAIAHHEVTRSLNSKLDMVRARIGTLTPRERQVFELVVRGKTNKHVANTVGSTERTIKAHRQRMMEKMQVQSLAELVSLAERVGLLGGASGSG